MLLNPKDSRSTRYLWPLQSRTSLLTWKLFGRRTDGFPEKLVSSAQSDYHSHLSRGGLPYSPFKGSIMPPPEAVAGTYEGPDGQKIQVAPLTDEDRRTLVRWIDLGCPIDLDFDPKHPEQTGRGWLLDDQRPTVTLAEPQPGANDRLTRLLVGMYDYGTGLIAERTRDKVAAARRKGKWSGGLPVLGYDVDARTKKLVVNEEEATRA